jgi:AraC-like DNA-binding protein
MTMLESAAHNVKRDEPKTRMVFHQRSSNAIILGNSHCNIHAVTEGPAWHGLHLEVGEGSGWSGDDLMVDGHMIGMNLADEALSFEIRDVGSKWTPVVLPPGGVWIIPEGQIWSVRHDKRTFFASSVVNGRMLDSVCGGHYELRASYDIVDPVLTLLIRSLVEQLLARDGTALPRVTESLVRNFMFVLGVKYGTPAAEGSFRGGIAPCQLKGLLDWLGDNIGSEITVESMAAHVKMSSAHFSREFKRSTGSTPWGMVVALRLERAKQLLAAGETAYATSLRCGFFDQAHLSRLFKQRFGMSPSAWAIAARRPAFTD